MAPAPVAARCASFDRSTMRVIASSQVAGSSRPLAPDERRRQPVGARVRLPAVQAFRPQPAVVHASPARPRTPTIRPSGDTDVEAAARRAQDTAPTGPSARASRWSARRRERAMRRHAASGAPRCRRCCPGSGRAASSRTRPPFSSCSSRCSIRCERGLHLVLAVLRFGAALVDEIGRRDDQDQDLEELGLPVLEGPLAEVDRRSRCRPESVGGCPWAVWSAAYCHQPKIAWRTKLPTNSAPTTMLRL